MSFTLSAMAENDARAHALADYPREACGLIVDGLYVPCTNIAAEPLANFKIAGVEILARTKGKRLEAIVHSHPTANAAPSENDMRAQLGAALPFVIVPTNGETCGTTVMWGDGVAIPDLVGREFMHGVTDCYSSVRDFFRLPGDVLEAQGFPRPAYEPFTLPEVPREDGWWGRPGEPGEDLYTKGFEPNGFVRISHSEARPGDGFLCRIRSEQLNHAGVLVSNDLIFHHLPGRLSRREPAGIWARSAEVWVRRVSPTP